MCEKLVRHVIEKRGAGPDSRPNPLHFEPLIATRCTNYLMHQQ